SNPTGTFVHGSNSPAVAGIRNFALNVPPTATILGVEVFILSTNNYNQMSAALGILTGSFPFPQTNLLGSWKPFTGGPSNTSYLLGSPTDLWGNTTATLTPA